MNREGKLKKEQDVQNSSALVVRKDHGHVLDDKEGDVSVVTTADKKVKKRKAPVNNKKEDAGLTDYSKVFNTFYDIFVGMQID